MTLARFKLERYIEKMKKKGVTQEIVAKHLDCSRSYLSELISGKKTAPSIKMAAKIQFLTKTVKIGDWNAEL